MSHIAVVDDDPDMLLFFKLTLGEHHEVIGYPSGAACLADIAFRVPSCILVDIDLGDMNGISVLRALRAHDRLSSVPVIAVTSHNKETERAKYLGEGFNDFLAKPVAPEILLSTVQAALRGECDPFLDEDYEPEYVAPAK